MCLAHAEYHYGLSLVFFLRLSNIFVMGGERGWSVHKKQPNQSPQRRNDANGRRHGQQRHGRKHTHNHGHKPRTPRMKNAKGLPIYLTCACVPGTDVWLQKKIGEMTRSKRKAPNDEDQRPSPNIRHFRRGRACQMCCVSKLQCLKKLNPPTHVTWVRYVPPPPGKRIANLPKQGKGLPPTTPPHRGVTSSDEIPSDPRPEDNYL